MAERYVALLRGINVGGKNKVPMADLRDAFQGAGYEQVQTYIQSGNVIFETDADQSLLEPHLEEVLAERFGFPIPVMVRSHEQLAAAVEKAPDGFGSEPDIYYSDVIFLKDPLTADRVMEIVKLREGVDQAWPGDGVAYFARLAAERQRSLMSRIVSTPEYKFMTIRSWATTTKLLELMDQG